MAVSPTTCPSEHVLEGIAIGHAATPDVQSHVASCLVCQHALLKLRDDNQFLRGFLAAGGLPDTAATPMPPIDIPGYEIIRELHHGGQGVVYLAAQRATKRDVAIKIMRRGPFATLADRARFEREVEILGRLNHPNIVAVHDAGVVAGFHYFVMNYVDGKPLDEAVRDLSARALQPIARAARVTDDDKSWPDATPLPHAARRTHIAARRGWIELFIKACDAVHAAHLRGVIHRDLKPSNIYVDLRGEPHVLDFGIAKSTDSENLAAMTQTGQFVGSLPWASPEQVEGTSSRIDLRTDVYSLGAILYQLLTGMLPFDVGSNLRHAVNNILCRSPARPSTVAAQKGETPVDDELDTVVLKCLAKDPARRYQSAGELARDLRRYLAGEPIEAKRDSALYVLRKAMRRYRLRVAIATVFVVFFGLFGGVMAVLYRRSAQLEHEASQAADSLAMLLSRSNIEQGRMAAMLGNLEQAERLLWRELLVQRPPTSAATLRLNEPPGPPEAYWALWELYRRFPCLRNLSTEPPVGRSVRLADSGANIWTSSADGTARKLNAAGDELESFHMAFEMERGLPLIDSSGRFVLKHDGAAFALWRRTPDGSLAQRIELAPATLTMPDTACISQSGRRVAAVIDGVAIVWNTDPPAELARFEHQGAPLAVVSLSNDDRMLAVRDRLGGLHIWNIESGQVVAEASGRVPLGPSVRDFGPLLFSPDGRRLADAWSEITGRIWNLDVDPPTFTEFSEHAGDYRTMGFSPDGRRLAVGDLGGTLRIFDSESGERLWALIAHHGRIMSVAFTSDGRGVWTCGNDGDLRMWEIESDDVMRIARIDGETFHTVDFSDDGNALYAAGGLGTLHRLDREARVLNTVAFGSTATVSCVATSPDGARVAAATYGDAVYIWDSIDAPAPPARLAHPNRVSYLCFSPDGTRLATAGDDGVIRVWRTADHTLDREFRGVGDRTPQIAFDPAGQRLALAVRSGSLMVWNIAADVCETWGATPFRPLRTVRFTPDGRWLLAAGADRTIGVWDAGLQQRVATLVGHNQEIFCLDVRREGELIASGDTSGTVRLWHAGLRQPLATFEGHSNSVMAVRFSPDGAALATASLDGTVRIWNLAHFGRHIAGNLDSQIRRIGADGADPDGAAEWREWGAKQSARD